MAQLAIKALTLSHFRSHKRAVLEPAPGPIAIFGPNGAGKTNILEAVSLLSPGRGMRRATADEMVRQPDAVGWKVTALIEAGTGLHEIETWTEGGTGRAVRIDAKAAPQVALGRIARVLWLVPSMDRLWIEAAEGRRRFLDRMTMSFLPGHGDAVLGYEKAMRERNRMLKDGVGDPAWYSAVEAQMARFGAEIDTNRRDALARVAAAQEGADTAFPAAELALVTTEGAAVVWDGPGLRAALAESRGADLRAGRSLVGPHRADLEAVYAAKAIAARQCSTGEQKALLISLVLANARALAAEIGTAPLILLDEVAAHLDEARRAALYDEVVALGAQAWMTGTEKALFEALGPRGSYFTVRETGGISEVTAVPF